MWSLTSEGSWIQVTSKMIEQIVDRGTGVGPGDGTHAQKRGFH